MTGRVLIPAVLSLLLGLAVVSAPAIRYRQPSAPAAVTPRAARVSGDARAVLPKTYRPVPACPEDEVLVPAGAFTPVPGTYGGRWSRYRCGPARDDYQGGGR